MVNLNRIDTFAGEYMKQKGRNIIILFLASIIFYVGAGVTVVDLCCSNCVENLLVIQKEKADCPMEQINTGEHSCCQEVDGTEDGILPCTNPHEGKCCEAERISIDIDNRTYKPDVAGMNMNGMFLHCFCCCFCHTDNLQEIIADAEYIQDVSPLPPRDYLSLIRVLII